MAITPTFIDPTQFPYTVPTGKFFSGSVLDFGAGASMTLNGNAWSSFSNLVNFLTKSFFFAPGDVINGAQFTLVGLLQDVVAGMDVVNFRVDSSGPVTYTVPANRTLVCAMVTGGGNAALAVNGIGVSSANFSTLLSQPMPITAKSVDVLSIVGSGSCNCSGLLYTL